MRPIGQLAREHPFDMRMPEPAQQLGGSLVIDHLRGMRIAGLIAIAMMATMCGYPPEKRALAGHRSDHGQQDSHASTCLERAVRKITVEPNCDTQLGQRIH